MTSDGSGTSGTSGQVGHIEQVGWVGYAACLPPELRPSALHAYASAITDVFLYAAPVALLGFVLAWFLHEGRLRASVTAPDLSETRRAGYDLLPGASWLLLRIRRHGRVEPAALAQRGPVPLSVVPESSRQVEVRHLARREGLELVLTDDGFQAADRLARAREDSLAELLGDWWGPDRPTDLVQLAAELSTEMCGSDAERPHDGGGNRKRPYGRAA